MVFLSITTDTWIVTGLGFGIVLVLLICLVYIMDGLGWVMQKITAPKAEKPKNDEPSVSKAEKKSPEIAREEPDEATKVVIAVALAEAKDDEIAIAMALYLYQKNARHDIPTASIAKQARNTAWNFKSIGLNNVGF